MFFGIVFALADAGAGQDCLDDRRAAAAVAVALNGFPGSIGVAVVTGVARLVGDVGVVVVAVHISADAVAIRVANTRTGGRRAGTFAIGIDGVAGRGRVSVVAGVAGKRSDVGVRVTIHAMLVDAYVNLRSQRAGSAPEILQDRHVRTPVDAGAGGGQPEKFGLVSAGADKLRVAPETVRLEKWVGVPVLLEG